MINQNRKNYSNNIEDNSISFFFSGEAPYKTADQKYRFVVNKNFYYLTNIEKEKFVLVLIKNDKSLHEFLFIEKGNPTLEKWEGKRMSKKEASDISGIPLKNIYFDTEFESVVHSFLNATRTSKFANLDKVYLDLERKSFTVGTNNYVKIIQDNYPNMTIFDSYKVLCSLRMYKNKFEIENIKKAINITKDGIYEMMKNTSDCTYEYQLESHFNKVLSYNNVHNSFHTIAASGVNATVLHYGSNDSKIEKDSLILFDLGCEYNQYASDISRTFPVSGKFTEIQKNIYNIVLKANEECIKLIKPGVTLLELNNHAKDILSKGLMELDIMSDPKELVNYYYHGLGHHLGLDVHDPAIASKPLDIGCVITIEPGLYIEKLGIGIRIEDDILVTKDGYENLSKDIIKSVDDIEKFMKSK